MKKSELLILYGLIVVAFVLIAVGAPIHPVLRALIWVVIFVITMGVIVVLNQDDGPEEAFATAGNAIKDFLFNAERTEILGTVLGRRVDGLMTDHPRFYVRISQTVIEVPSRLYESVSDGQDVVLTFRGGQSISIPDDLKSRTIVSITPLKYLARERRSKLEQDQIPNVRDVENQYKKSKRKDKTSRRQVEHRRIASVNRQRSVDMCNSLRKLGIEAKLLEDSPVYIPTQAGHSRPAGSIELKETRISRIRFDTGDHVFGTHEYCDVPEPRFRDDLDLDNVEVRSRRLKRFPIFGSVQGVHWRTGSPDFDTYDLIDSDFSDYVADHLNRDPKVTEAILLSEIDVQVFWDWDENWTIVAKNTPVTDWTLIVLNCVTEVGNSLLAMPFPEPE